MKKILKTITLSSLLIFSVYSCTNQINNTSEIKSIKPEKTGKVLVGKAVFPASRKEVASFKTKSFNTKSNFKTKGLKIKAIPSDISSISTISVIIPSDSATTPNKTIATGITDISGNFQIDMSAITLVNNSIYVLEASKRTGKDVETIRTFIKWNGTVWESMTTGDALINETTTSVSIIASYLNVPSSDLISKIDPANISDIYDSTNTTVLITKADITKVAGLINSVLLGEKDPIALIKYDVSKPYKFFVDQTYNFYSITSENGCTGCSFIGANFSTSGVSLSGKDLSYSDLSGQDLSTQDLSETILVGADLRGANLPNDLSYLDLSETKLTTSDLKNGSGLKNLTGTDLSFADLTGIDLSGISGTLSDLTKTRLTGCNFKDANLQYTNLKGVHLFDATFENTKIKESDLTNADLTAVDLSGIFNKEINNLILVGTNLTGANLSNLDLTTIKNKDMTGTLVSGITMENAILSGIDLSNKNFFQANLSGAVFTGAGSGDNKLQKANFRNADLSKAKLNLLNLSDLNFTNCDLSDAVLTGSSAIGTNFTGANLQRAFLNTAVNFIRTKFISADMRNLKAFKSCTDVNFSYADMSGFNLTNAGMASVSFIKSALGTGCIFTKAKLNQCVFNGASTTFANSRMDGTEMIDSSFRNNNFSNVLFFSASNGAADLSNSDFNSANFLSSSISNSLRSLTTSFVVALWWNGQNCSSSSNQGVCKDNAGNVIL